MALAFLLADPVARRRYERFVKSMVYGESVTFDAALQTAAAMVNDAWPAR